MRDCCGLHGTQGLSRRGLLRGAGLGGAALALQAAAPRVWAAEPIVAGAIPDAGPAGAAPPAAPPQCDLLLLTCMDFRLQTKIVAYMDQRGFKDKYDHVALAGGSLGVLMEQRPEWQRVFWDHMETAIKLDHVRRIMVLDHLDCSAYRVVLGEAAVKDPALETAAHAQRLRLLRSAINEQYPMQEVELGIMALDGAVQPVI